MESKDTNQTPLQRQLQVTQLKLYREYLRKHIATNSMVADALQIPQKNLCRYKRELEKLNLLWEVKKAICQKTGFVAVYLTTDPDKAPFTPQLKLF
ncbi:MAG: hypothetical protein ACPGLV_14005 [Bacteroidia bacterium]